jgi:large subunit ribosomal protein L10
MPTPQKEQIVQEMSEKFGKASSVYLLDFTGMDVNMTNALRKNFRETEVEYRVMKNTLAKLSFGKAGIAGLDDYLKGVNAYAISYDDPTKPAKVLDKNKEFKEKLKYKAAYFEGKVLGPDEVEALASLPTRDELLGQVVGMLQSPMTKLANVLNGTMSKFLLALKAIEQQKNKE